MTDIASNPTAEKKAFPVLELISPKIFTLLGVMIAWQMLSVANDRWHFYNATLVPSPLGILSAAIDLWRQSTLWPHVAASCIRVIEGMAIAIPIGILLAYVVATYRWAAVMFDPIIELIRPIPSLALLPLFIVWFGIGELTKVAFISYSAFFIIYIATLEAIRDVDPILLRAAGSLGFSRQQTAYHVTFKAVFPHVMVAVRIALATSWFVIVGAEFLAANEGLGYLINVSRVWFQINTMMAGAALIGLLGLGSNYLLLSLERRLFAWRDRKHS